MDLARLMDAAAASYGLPVSALSERGKRGLPARQVVCFLAYRHGLNITAVGQALGYRDHGAPYFAAKACGEKMERSRDLAERVGRIDAAACRDPWIDLVPFRRAG